MIFVGLTPNRFTLGLYAALGAEYAYGAVQHTQAALHLYGKVNVAGGIDNVNPVAFPLAGRRSGGNGDTTLLLLGHPVHGRRTLVRFAHAVNASGVE